MSRWTRTGRTRGRPRHPDILTPREWEVLALLREHLTNEEIAARLGITLDGAKYHVSEILGKLGVATREEATLWRPPERRPSWARAALSIPIAARVAGALTIAATGGGIGVLAWGVIETGAPGEEATAPRTEASPPGEELIDAGRTDDYAVDEPVHFDDGFWLVKRESGEVIALSEMDTHPRFSTADCPIEWRADQTSEGRTGWFRGRCSGSNFGLDGHRESGPSPRGMGRYRVQRFEDQISVDTGLLLCGPGDMTSGEPCTPAWPNQLPSPAATPVLSLEAAILKASQSGPSGPLDVEAALTTHSAAKVAVEDESMSFPEPADDAPEWFILFRGMYSQYEGAIGHGGPFSPGTPPPPVIACREVIVRFPDSQAFEGASSTLRDARLPCDQSQPVSREAALIAAADAVSWLDPPQVAAELTTYGQALLVISNPELTPRPVPNVISNPELTPRPVPDPTGGTDAPAWLVTLRGRFLQPEGSSPPGGTPRPTTIALCGTAYVIVDASTRETQMYLRAPSSCP